MRAVSCVALLLMAAWSAHASAQPDEAAPAAPTWQLRLFAGAGIGMRALDLPRDGVVSQTRTGVFPALDLEFALNYRPSEAFGLGLRARYQTSLGLQIVERHSDGSGHQQALRSHRLELALTPSYRLDARGLWVLGAALGYGLCDLRPEVHLQTPGYGLGGPFLRVELQIPLGTEHLRLRLGPELQWIAVVGEQLRDEGFASHGLGIGGAAALQVVISDRWLVEATYNELRAWLDSPQAESLQDVTRFITARLSGTL